MSYTPTNWVTGDVITADKLNKSESGIQNNESNISALSAKLPPPPEEDGEYALTATIDSGDTSYSWEPGGGGGGVLINKTFTANGVYLPQNDNADGYKKATVALPLGTKNISANGTYNAQSDGLAAYTELVVNVPQEISGGRCPRTDETAEFQYGLLLLTMAWESVAYEYIE